MLDGEMSCNLRAGEADGDFELNPGSALADFVEKRRTLEAITEEEPSPMKKR